MRAPWPGGSPRTSRPLVRPLVRPPSCCRAVEAAQPIGLALGVTPVADCGLWTWHVPPVADGMPTAEFPAFAVEGGGVFRPFEPDNECSAELVVRTGRSIMDLAHPHRATTVVLVGHTETVERSFHVLAAQPLHHAFDLAVAPASVTERTGSNHVVDNN